MQEDPKLKHKLAIKISRYDPENADVVTTQRREFDILTQLKHVSLIQVHRFYSCEQRCFTVMERADGQTLSHFIRKNEAFAVNPVKLTKLLFAQLLESVDYLHSQSVCHRDIKPDNVIVAGDLTVKLIDFNVAVRL